MHPLVNKYEVCEGCRIYKLARTMRVKMNEVSGYQNWNQCRSAKDLHSIVWLRQRFTSVTYLYHIQIIFRNSDMHVKIVRHGVSQAVSDAPQFAHPSIWSHCYRWHRVKMGYTRDKVPAHHRLTGRGKQQLTFIPKDNLDPPQIAQGPACVLDSHQSLKPAV